MPNPRLPDYVPALRDETRATRASRQDLDRAASGSTPRQANVAGDFSPIPLVYGRVSIGGQIHTAVVDSGTFYCSVIWGYGEFEEIETVYIDDATAPAGATITHYTGTTSQGVDATLSGVISGYSDTHVIEKAAGAIGIAYSVLAIDEADLDGWPRIRAIVKGRKVYDERTETTAYSNNPGLCTADLISDARIGRGLTVLGVTEVADRCDEVIDSEPRMTLGIEIRDPQESQQWERVLAEYAEAFVVDEGTAVRLVPDGVVTDRHIGGETMIANFVDDQYLTGTTVRVVSGRTITRRITASEIVAGTFEDATADTTQAPTEIEVQYTDAAGVVTEAWGSSSAIARLAGVSDGTVPRIPSTVPLPGTQRFADAFRKASSRLRSLQLPGRWRWVTYQRGMTDQVGDVVELHVPQRGLLYQPVRIKAIRKEGGGLYSISAVEYSPSAYPVDAPAPEGTVSVPDGLIVPKLSGDTPTGWTDYSAPAGAYIIGAGGSLTPGDTGGGGNVTVSGTTSTNGAHTGDQMFDARKGQDDGFAGENWPTVGGDRSRGSHNHTYSETHAPEPTYQQWRLIQKDGAGTEIPNNAAVFSDGEIIDTVLQALTGVENKMIREGSTANGGQMTESINVSLSAEPNHRHGAGYENSESDDIGFGGLFDTPDGGHEHPGTTADVTVNPRRRRLAAYSADQDFALRVGMIAMWAGTEGNTPSGWRLCDGANGSPDLREFFVELSTPENAGGAVGNDTASWTLDVPTDGQHDHDGGFDGSADTVSINHRDNDGVHFHTGSGQASWRPSYYALYFIQATG